MKYPFKPFQRTTVDYGIKNPYSIYALKQGLGKSYCGIATAVETASRCLIVCPAYLRFKWKAEIEKFYPGKIVSLFTNDKEFYPVWDSDFVIISYSYVGKAEILFEWADIVIFDEAQYLKTMEAIRTMDAHRLIYENSIKRCLLLTGTPIQNRVYEFYSLIAICNYDPRNGNKSAFLDKFPSYVDFANHFSILKEFDVYRGNKRVRVQQWEGCKNVAELKNWIKDCYIRFGDEVLGLDEPIHIEVPVCYKDDPDLLAEFERFTANGEETSTDSRAKAKAALAKVPFTFEYVKNLLDQGEQVVVYTDHVISSQSLGEKLGVVGITGQTNMKLRQQMADDFMAKKSNVIVATIGSFSTGIDLFSAHNMVFNDANWVPGNMDQAMYRIRRIGQTKRCNFHYIIGSYQDEAIYRKLREKIEVIKEVI